jgi:polysaccharide biosynthesis/export protein
MRLSSKRLLLVAALCFVLPGALAAQARPTPDQAAELLRNRPDLVQQLRQRIGTSGLTPDQVRARLRAEGYPENLLDAYLPGSSAGAADSLPDASVLAAVRALGISDSTDFAQLTPDVCSDLTSELDPFEPDTGDVFLPRRRDPPTPATLPNPNRLQRATGSDTVRADSNFIVPREEREARDVRALREQRCREQRQRQALERRLRVLPRSQRLALLYPDSGFAIFGLDVFAASTSQFDANVAGPVDANYRLGPGDRLVLILTGDVEAAHQLEVTREGFVVIPQVGQLYVANTTLGQLEDLLYSRLGRVYSGVRRGAGATTRFSVHVSRLRSNQIYVMGDVTRPGSYRISGAGTALTALYAAGGPSENGSLRAIEVRRAGRTVGRLDLYDYLLRGDASQDVRLETGDVVFVPVHGARARVVGEVTRPATYEMQPTETFGDLVRFAGGFLPTATRRRVQVERVLPPEQRVAEGRDRTVLDVAADAAGAAEALRLPVAGGDLVKVFPVAERVRNRVAVRGNVWTPGSQALAPGMRLSDALRAAGGVKPDVYLGQVLVTRLRSDSTRVQMRATLRDTTGAVVNDFLLREDDEVRVFSVTEFRPTRYVAINGAVRRSGQYPYREGMTIRDLVLLAGGLKESAFLQEAEVARLPENRANGVTARTTRVPLDSSYLFERGPDGRYVGAPGLPAPAGTAPEVPLLPYDNVLILQQPDWELQRSVSLTGEVRFPGRYTLVRKDERLTDVIRRAGGLTTSAHADGIMFYRRHDRTGRIGLDLPSAMRDRDHSDNLLLEDGDSVVVPKFTAVVQVAGAVNSPIAVAYVPGRNIDYYIRSAGGFSRRADSRRAYVTQPNGKVESVQRRTFAPDGVPEPRPGGRVFVPERDPTERRDTAQLAGIIAQVISSLVAVTVAVVSIRNSQ